MKVASNDPGMIHITSCSPNSNGCNSKAWLGSLLHLYCASVNTACKRPQQWLQWQQTSLPANNSSVGTYAVLVGEQQMLLTEARAKVQTDAVPFVGKHLLEKLIKASPPGFRTLCISWKISCRPATQCLLALGKMPSPGALTSKEAVVSLPPLHRRPKTCTCLNSAY